MDIEGSVALVTGANRGMGRHFVEQIRARGAAKVYATARRPEQVDLPGVEVLRLDVTDPDSITAAARVATDVDLLVNNAGLSTGVNLLDGDVATVRLEMEVHFFGTLAVTRAFAPALGRNGGGAVLNMLSVLSWYSPGVAHGYAAAKAAEWALTNSTRLELAGQGTLVTGVFVAAVDTDMMAGYDVPKAAPADVVRAALDAVAADRFEAVADDTARRIKASLADDPAALYGPMIAAARAA